MEYPEFDPLTERERRALELRYGIKYYVDRDAIKVVKRREKKPIKKRTNNLMLSDYIK